MSQPPRAGSVPRQAAVIAVRGVGDEVEVCLIRRRGSRKWGIPKGFIDRGDTPEQAALNEAFEEAGLRGQLRGGVVGTYFYEKWGAALTVAVYVMEVLDEEQEWQEMRFRERSWYPMGEAALLLIGHPVRPLLDDVKKLLSPGLS